MTLVGRELAAELSRLSDGQREAATHPGDVVVRAGPGSGKTRTLVARVGYTLATRTSPLRGVACITYTNTAAREVRHRLADLGVRSGERLACSTLHAFCLNEIVRPFAGLTGGTAPGPGSVIGSGAADLLLQHCLDSQGVNEAARWRLGTITSIRRALAIGDPTDRFDAREVEAARTYETALAAAGQVDFEAMTIRALALLQEHGPVRDLVGSRFPHLVVDEYQDLGGVLHRIVLELRHSAGVEVFAVGDIDQTVFGFAGAEPRFFEELAAREDFLDVSLDINYRSAARIVRACEAALGRTVGRTARDGAPDGEIKVMNVTGGQRGHAEAAAGLVAGALRDGVPPHRVAVLYPSRGPLLTELLAAIQRKAIPVLCESEEPLPRGPLSTFVQRCAAATVATSQVRLGAAELPTGLGSARQVPGLDELAHDLRGLRRDAGLPAGATALSTLVSL